MYFTDNDFKSSILSSYEVYQVTGAVGDVEQDHADAIEMDMKIADSIQNIMTIYNGGVTYPRLVEKAHFAYVTKKPAILQYKDQPDQIFFAMVGWFTLNYRFTVHNLNNISREVSRYQQVDILNLLFWLKIGLKKSYCVSMLVELSKLGIFFVTKEMVDRVYLE